MEMFFLSYVKETVHLLWNLPFFKMVSTRLTFSSFLKPWADNSSTNQYLRQLFYGWGNEHLMPSYLKMHIVEEGPGETPSAMRCLSYLINSFLTDIKLLLKLAAGLAGGHSPSPFLCLCQKHSLSSFIL